MTDHFIIDPSLLSLDEANRHRPPSPGPSRRPYRRINGVGAVTFDEADDDAREGDDDLYNRLAGISGLGGITDDEEGDTDIYGDSAAAPDSRPERSRHSASNRQRSYAPGRDDGAESQEDDEAEDAADVETLRELQGSGRIRKSDFTRNKDERDIIRRKARASVKKKHQPTHEVRLIYAQAMETYMAGDVHATIPKLEEVLRLDQLFGDAWNTLASCYEEVGPAHKARIMRFGALHFEGDAEDWKNLAISFKQDEMYDEAIHCLRKALKSDNTDVLAYWELADIYKARDNITQALQSLGRILKLDPVSAHDFTLLTEFLPLYKTSKVQKQNGIKALREAWQYHLDTFDGPRDQGAPIRTGDEEDDGTQEEQRPSDTMRLDHVLTFIDLLLEMDQLEEALDVIKKGQRWLQGRYRHAEGDWAGTEMEDDREYDPPDLIRSDANEQKNDQDDEKKRWPLMASFRHRLALIRLRLGHIEEANIHANCILALDEERWQDIFIELGDEMILHENWHMGARLFGKINDNDSIIESISSVYKLGQCMHELYKQDTDHADAAKRRSIARDAFEWVKEADPTNMQARLRLANVYDEMGMRAEALEIVTEVMRYTAANEPPSRRGARERKSRATMNVDLLRSQPEGSGTKAERNARAQLSKSVYQDQMRQNLQGMLQELHDLEATVAEKESREAFEEYMMLAGSMVETFRLAGRNFGKNRGVSRVKVNVRKRQGSADAVADEANDLQSRLERELGIENDPKPDEEEVTITKRQTDFYGIGAEEWMALIIKYCVVLTDRNESRLALEILEHTIWANLFFNYRCELTFRIAIIACALRARSWPRIVQNCRRLTQMHQFSTEPFQIMLACLQSGGIKAHAASQANSLQKFVLRELRLYEAAASGKRFHLSIRDRRWAEEKQAGLSENLGDDVQSEDDDEDDGSPVKGSKKDEAWQRGKRYEIDHDATVDDPPQDELDAYTAENDLSGPMPKKPSIDSPMWNYMYGQLMLTARSHHTSLFYLLRAYEISPNDPLICLLIAQAFFTRSQNRQVDNRNQATAQRYRKLSPVDAESVEEVEYNFARSFHGLGIPHLAAKHYELVLESVQRRMDALEGGPMIDGDVGRFDRGGSAGSDRSDPAEDIRRSSLAYEAAFNLMLIYGASGSTDLVRQKSKWLAI